MEYVYLIHRGPTVMEKVEMLGNLKIVISKTSKSNGNSCSEYN